MSKSLKKLIDINRLREFKNKLNAQNVFESLPAGIIIPFAGTSVPTGCLLCNGAAVSRTNYANLFAAIGTRYGAGDGSTTFNLPDARDRVLQGASGTHSTGSYIAAGLPDINGTIPFRWPAPCPVANVMGVFSWNAGADPNVARVMQSSERGQSSDYIFKAKQGNALYGASNTVQSPAIATNFIIKY